MDKHDRDSAEGDIIDLLRRNDAQNFRLTITCQGGQWTVEVVDLDAPITYPRSDMTIGEGATFTEAWQAQNPTWAKEGE